MKAFSGGGTTTYSCPVRTRSPFRGFPKQLTRANHHSDDGCLKDLLLLWGKLNHHSDAGIQVNFLAASLVLLVPAARADPPFLYIIPAEPTDTGVIR